MSKFLVLFGVAALAAILYSPLALATPILGSAQGFAVLGHETVTSAHSAPKPTTQIYGDLGVTPKTSVIGFYPDGAVSGGTIHIDDGVAQLALTDATTAYNMLAGSSPAANLTGQDLGGMQLTPGVYHFDAAAQLTGALTLDFLGDPDAAFIFQIGTTLTTASASSVNVINGNSTSGVYWQVGSSATLGADTTFAGNILANASVTLDSTAKILCGRAFALTGGVTLIDNLISNNNSAEDFGSGRPDFGSYGFSGSAAPVPVISVVLDSNSWSIGTISPGDVLWTGPFTTTNNGNVPEDFTIVGSDATNGWTLGTAVGLDTFKVEADLGNDGSYETLLSLSRQPFATNVAVSGTRLLGLRYSAPDDDTKGDNVSHDFSVTIRAVRHVP